MKLIEQGDKVQVECEAKLPDGTVCYKNKKGNPVIFVVGEGKFFPGIENEMKEMKEGDTKKITLKPEDAFGKHDEDLVAKIPKKELATQTDLNLGSVIKMKTSSDQLIEGIITEIDKEILTVDFNHPLVDMEIIFTITINSIEKG